MIDNRFAAVVRLDHQLVLVCPSNKFNTGLDVSDVHSILDDVCNVGWDWEEVGIPICFELPAGEEGKQVIAFNEHLTENAQGFLSPADKQHADEFVMRVTCSHRVAAIRCVAAGSSHVEHRSNTKRS